MYARMIISFLMFDIDHTLWRHKVRISKQYIRTMFNRYTKFLVSDNLQLFNG